MGVTKDKRKEKIRELKVALKASAVAVKELQTEFTAKVKHNVWTPEERAAKLKELTELRAVSQGVAEELTKTRLNKTGSKFYEFIPSPPNRARRRAMARRVHV